MPSTRDQILNNKTTNISEWKAIKLQKSQHYIHLALSTICFVDYFGMERA